MVAANGAVPVRRRTKLERRTRKRKQKKNDERKMRIVDRSHAALLTVFYRVLPLFFFIVIVTVSSFIDFTGFYLVLVGFYWVVLGFT